MVPQKAHHVRLAEGRTLLLFPSFLGRGAFHTVLQSDRIAFQRLDGPSLERNREPSKDKSVHGLGRNGIHSGDKRTYSIEIITLLRINWCGDKPSSIAGLCGREEEFQWAAERVNSHGDGPLLGNVSERPRLKAQIVLARAAGIAKLARAERGNIPLLG